MKIYDMDLDSLSLNEFLSFINCLICYLECNYGYKYELVKVNLNVNTHI